MNPNSRLGRQRSPLAQGRNRVDPTASTAEAFVGIDVSKDRLHVVLTANRPLRCTGVGISGSLEASRSMVVRQPPHRPDAITMVGSTLTLMDRLADSAGRLLMVRM